MSLYHCITSACLVLNLRRLAHPGIRKQRPRGKVTPAEAQDTMADLAPGSQAMLRGSQEERKATRQRLTSSMALLPADSWRSVVSMVPSCRFLLTTT